MNNTFPDSQARSEENQVVKIPFRIGAGMLFVSAAHGILSSVLVLILNGSENLGFQYFENLVISLINIVVGLMLWQRLKGSVRYSIVWALLLFLNSVRIGGSYVILLGLGFSGSLILLLTGKPSNARTITAVVIFVVVYLGLLCLGFTSYYLPGYR